MSVRDYFVAGVAVAIALLALASAFRVPTFGLEERAYRLRSLQAIEDRWGERAARLVLLIVATVMFFVSISIVAQSIVAQSIVDPGRSTTSGSLSLPKSNRR